MGRVMYEAGHRNVATVTWRYTAGQEMVGGFKEGFTKVGGTIVEDLVLPFPDVEFQALIRRLTYAEARCGIRLLRRRGSRAVRQGL